MEQLELFQFGFGRLPLFPRAERERETIVSWKQTCQGFGFYFMTKSKLTYCECFICYKKKKKHSLIRIRSLQLHRNNLKSKTKVKIV